MLSSHKARALIATIKSRDIVGKTRRRLAVELIVELEGIEILTAADPLPDDLRDALAKISSRPEH